MILSRYIAACMFVLLLYAAHAQQIVQRGPLGKPALVMDETGIWTTPLLVSGDPDAQIYIPDISAPQWLERNYPDFLNRNIYTLSLFTFYRTPAACRANQINWGLGDAAHLNACIDIGYRVRRALVDPVQKSVTLQTAAMVDQNGNVIADSIEDKGVFRTWDQLDANTATALKKANAFVTEQMAIYDRKVQSAR